MEKQILLTPEEQKRFNNLPPISSDQQRLIDSFAALMVEHIQESSKNE